MFDSPKFYRCFSLLILLSLAFLPQYSLATGPSATWITPPYDLSATGGAVGEPQVALSSDGTRATAVWLTNNSIIQSASATISGGMATWGTAVDLSATGALEPQVALSSDGTKATAIWSRNNGSNDIIQSTSATVSGGSSTWGSVADLSATGQNAGLPQVALSSDGTKAIAVWARYNGSGYTIMSASATISGGMATWGTAVDLSAIGQDAYNPQVALSSDGTKATVVWRRNNGSNGIIQSTSATVSGGSSTWGSVADLSATGQNAGLPQVALSSDGTKATAVWRRNNGSNYIIQSSSATVSGGSATWGTAVDLSAIGQDANNPQVALSSDGTKATVVWRRNNGSNGIIQSSSADIVYPPTPSAVPTLSGYGQIILGFLMGTLLWMHKGVIR